MHLFSTHALLKSAFIFVISFYKFPLLSMSFLTVSGISKHHNNNTVVNNISFTVAPFTKLAIAGETGSGKSSLLKIIAGLIQPDAGEVIFIDKRVRGPLERLLPGHRGIAYLSQHFELRNNYTVGEELDYTNNLTTEEASTIYKICRINHLLQRKTDQVSGGEKQRIALARQLTLSPKLLLLDEPYSNLDMIHKSVLKLVIHDVAEQLNITCMLISHDPNDTLSWADEIMVMKDGNVIQKATPELVYNQPVDKYAAALFGKYNLLKPATVAAFSGLENIEETGKKLFTRPENFSLSIKENDGVQGTIKDIRFYGSHYEAKVLLATGEPILVKTELVNLAKGDIVFVTLCAYNGWFL